MKTIVVIVYFENRYDFLTYVCIKYCVTFYEFQTIYTNEIYGYIILFGETNRIKYYIFFVNKTFVRVFIINRIIFKINYL